MKSSERIELILSSFCQYYYGHLSVVFGQWRDLRDFMVLQDEIAEDEHKTVARIIEQILQHTEDRYDGKSGRRI